MDLISLSTLVTLITQSAAGEAGKTAWANLRTLTRRMLGHDQHANTALEKAQHATPDGALELAGQLVQAAAANPDFSRLLRVWMTEASQATGHTTAVINTIGGNARIQGHVVQTGEIGTLHIVHDRPNTSA